MCPWGGGHRIHKDAIMDRLETWCGIHGVVWMIMADEVAPTTGMPHIQGYVVFKSARTVAATVKRLMEMDVHHPHVTIANGTAEENRVYCSKSDQAPWDWGTMPKMGERTDLETVRLAVLRGDTVRSLALAGMIRTPQQLRFAESLQRYVGPVMREETREVHWYWGPTGSGKTREAVRLLQERCPDDWVVIDPPYDFMDPYMGQAGVLFDDARAGGGSADFARWLRLLDRYPFQCNIKHGGLYFRADVVVVTCPLAPADFAAAWDQEDAAQLLRRIAVTKQFPLAQPAAASQEDLFA